MDKTKQTAPSAVPRHVAIIMDGNNRWAKKRFMPGVAGHKAGVDAVRAVIEVCAEAKVEVLTLFAFSSENWQRPADEVSALMDLFFKALRREAKRLNDNNITLRIIGDRSRFHPELQAAMREAEAMTAGTNRFVLQIAANYGGQWDIAQAAQRLAREVQAGDQLEAVREVELAGAVDRAALVDAVAEGRSGAIGPLIRRLEGQGTLPVTLCIFTLRHFRTLHLIAADPNGINKARVIFKLREAVQRQAGQWGQHRLEQALALLVETDMTLRSSTKAPAMALMERALIRLAMMKR